MKKYASIITITVCCSAFHTNAQGDAANASNSNQLIADASSDRAIISYHVVEKTTMAFGSTETTYEVSSLSLIPTDPLPANNVRIITPRYAKVKPKAVVAAPISSSAVALNIPAPEPIIAVATPIETTLPEVKAAVVAMPNTNSATMAPPTLSATAKPADKVYARVDIAGTYERILDKGYESIEMLKKVANAHYFDGDLAGAAKWYGQLFEKSPVLDALYYYRYAQALKAIDQPIKAGEMLKLFEKYKNL